MLSYYFKIFSRALAERERCLTIHITILPYLDRARQKYHYPNIYLFSYRWCAYFFRVLRSRRIKVTRDLFPLGTHCLAWEERYLIIITGLFDLTLDNLMPIRVVLIIEDTFLQQVAAQYLANSSSTVRPLVARQPLPSKSAAQLSYQDRDDDHYSPAEPFQPHTLRPPPLTNGYLNSDPGAAWWQGGTVQPASQVFPSSLLPPFESPKPFNQHPATTTAVTHAGGVISSATPAATPAKPQAGSKKSCLLYTSPSPRDGLLSRMPSSA